MAYVADPFVYVDYTTDGAELESVRMRQSVATALGYTGTATPANPYYTDVHKLKRHLYAKNQAAPYDRHRFVIGSTTDANWNGTNATITYGTKTLEIEGKIGERRLLSKQN